MEFDCTKQYNRCDHYALMQINSMRSAQFFALAAWRLGGLRRRIRGAFAVAQCSAGPWIDQMCLIASRAGHGFIGVALVRSGGLGEPSLHLKAGLGASINKGGHSPTKRSTGARSITEFTLVGPLT